MATGQIGFHRQKQVRKVHIEKRINEIINRLNKTKLEKFPDLAAEKAEFEKEARRKEKIALQEKVRIPFPLRGWVVYAKSVHRGRRRNGWLRRRRFKLIRSRRCTRICMDRRRRRRRRRRRVRIMIPRRISGDEVSICFEVFKRVIAYSMAFSFVDLIYYDSMYF